MRTVLTALVLATVLAATGCSADAEPDAGPGAEQTPASSEPTPTTAPASADASPQVAPPDLDRVARLFERFARGRMAGPPSDTPVTLYLGGHQRKVVTHPNWARPKAWRICPPGGGYAGRTCDFSAVDTIREYAGPLATTTRPPEHNCAHPEPLSPVEAGGTYSVTLTPDEELDCTSYWAVQLIVNDVSQVVAVNVVWAEP